MLLGLSPTVLEASNLNKVPSCLEQSPSRPAYGELSQIPSCSSALWAFWYAETTRSDNTKLSVCGAVLFVCRRDSSFRWRILPSAGVLFRCSNLLSAGVLLRCSNLRSIGVAFKLVSRNSVIVFVSLQSPLLVIIPVLRNHFRHHMQSSHAVMLGFCPLAGLISDCAFLTVRSS